MNKQKQKYLIKWFLPLLSLDKWTKIFEDMSLSSQFVLKFLKILEKLFYEPKFTEIKVTI